MSGPDTVKILFALSLPCTCMLLYWCRGQIVYETKMEEYDDSSSSCLASSCFPCPAASTAFAAAASRLHLLALCFSSSRTCSQCNIYTHCVILACTYFTVDT